MHIFSRIVAIHMYYCEIFAVYVIINYKYNLGFLNLAINYKNGYAVERSSL